jgi:hypothetical protein
MRSSNSSHGYCANKFTANWNAVTGATSYALDVATSSSFTFASTVASEPLKIAFSIFYWSRRSISIPVSSAAGDRPATSPFAAAGTYGYGNY